MKNESTGNPRKTGHADALLGRECRVEQFIGWNDSTQYLAGFLEGQQLRCKHANTKVPE